VPNIVLSPALTPYSTEVFHGCSHSFTASDAVRHFVIQSVLLRAHTQAVGSAATSTELGKLTTQN